MSKRKKKLYAPSMQGWRGKGQAMLMQRALLNEVVPVPKPKITAADFERINAARFEKATISRLAHEITENMNRWEKRRARKRRRERSR